MGISFQKHIKNSAQILQEKLKIQKERRPKKMGRAFLKETSSFIDSYFQDIYAKSLIGATLEKENFPCAVVAVGGYGRQEQNYRSDIDVLFLFKKEIPEAAKDLVGELIYPLWDLGFEIGHATRTTSETIELMKEDISVLTGVLDSRFVCGVSSLFLELTHTIQENFLPQYRDYLVEKIVDRNIERHIKFGDSSNMLEPNLKEGRGGLRDYHALLWISKAKLGVMSVRDLEYQGVLSANEYDSLERALEFIWNVRNQLHLLTNRKTDRLFLHYQEKIALKMSYVPKDGQMPVERFLGELHRNMEFIKKQYTVFLCEHGFFKKIFGQRKTTRRNKTKGLFVKKGKLFFVSSETIVQNRFLLMKIFEESAHLNVPLSAEAIRLVREFLPSVENKFWKDPEVILSFERVLVMPASVFNVLEQMAMTGLLEKFIPKFSTLVNRIQYNEYHIYPVDRHIIQTVYSLKLMMLEPKVSAEIDSFSVDIMKGLHHRRHLLWAALLHDIGKGYAQKDHANVGAEIAQKILEEKGFIQADIETIVFLVKEHLLLVKTVSRRDIEDDDVIASCARKIKTIERLRMLYLLTVADSISTGPKAWNSWMQSMLKEFFFRLYQYLESGEMPAVQAPDRSVRKRETIISEAVQFMPQEEIESLLEDMPSEYFLRASVEEALLHINLFRQLKMDTVAFHVAVPEIKNVRDITICVKDQPGLFSKLAGIFTLHGMDILTAYVMTWQNGVALDIFRVTPPKDLHFEEEKWKKVKMDLENVLTGKLNLSEQLVAFVKKERKQRTILGKSSDRIHIDNEASRKYSVVEVYTQSYPGLLFRLTNVLFEQGLTIQFAKISTKIDQVVDVFYVCTDGGRKLSAAEEIDSISTRLLAICTDVS